MKSCISRIRVGDILNGFVLNGHICLPDRVGAVPARGVVTRVHSAIIRCEPMPDSAHYVSANGILIHPQNIPEYIWKIEKKR